MNAFLHSRFGETFGWALLHSIWELAAIASLWAVALLCLRRAAASARYVLACADLLFMLAAPVATFAYLLPPAPRPAARTTELPPEVMVVPAMSAAPMHFTATPVIELSPIKSAPLPLAVRLRRLLTPWVPTAVVCYVLGAALMLLRLSIGYARLRKIVRSATRLQGIAAAQLTDLASRMRLSRPVRLLESAAIEVPTLIGALKPVILLPASALTGLSPDQLTALLAHELAHIRRHDYLANLVQSLIDMLLFYHPAAWWLSARIRTERELCCDDAAIAATDNRLVYARALAAMESLRGPASIALGVSGSAGSLLGRIRRILGAPRPTRRPQRLVSAASAAALVMVAATLVYLGCNKSPAPAPAAAPATPASSNAAANANDETKVRQYDIRYIIPRLGPAPAQGLADENAKAAALIDSITSTVAPDSWKDHGGSGTITFSNGRLTVSQSPENLTAVDKMLQDTFANSALAVDLDAQGIIVSNNFLDDFRIGWNLNLPTNNGTNAAASIIDNWTLDVLHKATQADPHTITISSPRRLIPDHFSATVAMTVPAEAGSSNIPATSTTRPGRNSLGTFSAAAPMSSLSFGFTAIVSADRRYVVLSIGDYQTSAPSKQAASHADTPGDKKVTTMVSVPDGGTLLIGSNVIVNGVDRTLLTLVHVKVRPATDEPKNALFEIASASVATTAASRPAGTSNATTQPLADQVLIKALIVEADAAAFAKAWAKIDPKISADGTPITGDHAGLADPALQKAIADLVANKQAEIISRPYVLAQDEQQAVVTIGQQTPYIKDIDPEKGRVPDIGYTTFGMTLDLLPHLHKFSVPAMDANSQGHALELDVNATLTGLTNNTAPAPNAQPGDPPNPVIDRRQASTRLTIGNDQTVMLLYQPAKEGRIDILFLTPHFISAKDLGTTMP